MKRLVSLGLALMFAAACGSSATPTPAATAPAASPTGASSSAAGSQPGSSPAAITSTGPTPGGRLTLLTHDAFAMSDSVLRSFKQQSGMTVDVLKSTRPRHRPLAEQFRLPGRRPDASRNCSTGWRRNSSPAAGGSSRCTG